MQILKTIPLKITSYLTFLVLAICIKLFSFYEWIKTIFNNFKQWMIRNWKKILGVTVGGMIVGGGALLQRENPPAVDYVSLVGRDFTTNTYYNSSSGQYHQTGYLQYINYQNETGVFHSINTSFQMLDSEHFAYQHGYRVYNDKGIFDVYLKANANANFPVAYAYNKGDDLNNTHVLRSGIVGVGYYDPSTNHEYSILQTPLSSIGSIDNDTASYSNIFSGADLSLTYQNSRFKEELILSNTTKTLLQNHPPSSFGYNNANSYVVVATELDYKNIYSYNGSVNITSNFIFNDAIKFKDKLGNILFSFVNAYAYEQNNISNVENMIMRIVHKNGHTYLLTGIKASVLNSMEFPVVLDPSPDTEYPSGEGHTYSDWTDPTYAYDPDDGDAYAQGGSVTQDQDYHTFGFSVSGTIVGIEVEVEAKKNFADVTIDCEVYDGTSWSSTAESHTFTSSTFAVHTFGNPTYLWGLSWTDTEINSNNFVVAFLAADQVIRMDYVKVIVYYTATTAPTVTTRTADTITTSGFRSGGTSLSDGGASITAKGVRYGTSTPPGSNSASSGTGTDNYYTTLSGKNENDLYYYRAYATNSVDTSYGSILSTSTLIGAPEESDIDVSAITNSTINLTIDPDPPRDTEGNTGVWYDGVSGTGVGSSVAWESFDSETWQDTGLSENSPYEYRAKFQNRVGTDSAYSSTDNVVYTYATPPANNELTVSSYGETWINWSLVDVDNNPDAGSTDGYFDIVTDYFGGSSGLSTYHDGTYYYFNDTGLCDEKEYGMKARYDNYDGVDTTYCAEVKQTTTASNAQWWKSPDNPIFVNSSGGEGHRDDLQVYGPQLFDWNETHWGMYYGGNDNDHYPTSGLTNNDTGFFASIEKANSPSFAPSANWTRRTNATGKVWPILDLGTDDWESRNARPEVILKEGDADYKMWYIGDNKESSHKQQLGYATSTDGLTWTKSTYNPIMNFTELGLGENGIATIALCKNQTSGEYWALYTSIDENSENVRLANSTDGINWTVNDTDFMDGCYPDQLFYDSQMDKYILVGTTAGYNTAYNWYYIKVWTADFVEGPYTDQGIQISAALSGWEYRAYHGYLYRESAEKWYMFYNGWDNVDQQQIGYATISRSCPYAGSPASQSFNTSVRTDGVDYFVWLGENVSAWDIKQNLTSLGFDEGIEYIAVWRNQ